MEESDEKIISPNHGERLSEREKGTPCEFRSKSTKLMKGREKRGGEGGPLNLFGRGWITPGGKRVGRSERCRTARDEKQRTGEPEKGEIVSVLPCRSDAKSNTEEKSQRRV